MTSERIGIKGLRTSIVSLDFLGSAVSNYSSSDFVFCYINYSVYGVLIKMPGFSSGPHTPDSATSQQASS